MIYRFNISTPANTAESAKQKTVLKVSRGVIHQLDIVYPPGPSGLLHLQIAKALHQLWPSNPSGSFAADQNMITFREHYELMTDPFQLEAYTWNLDDTHDHSVIIRLGILPRKNILRRLF